METKPQKQQTVKPRSKGVSAIWIILACAIVAAFFFFSFCGAGSGNIMDILGFSRFDEKGHPEPGDVFGILYQGGVIIPIVITLLLTVVVLSFERFFALTRASGKGNITQFVANAKSKLEAGDVSGAEKLCDEQKGSVANILKAGLVRYKDVENYADLNNDEKAELIQHEIEDATALELPYLEQNLPIIATISTLGTLFGLFGTVIGMIKSFQAMSQEGTPDSTKLALGISEALMNTAMGIGTGALAIISYNFFAGKVKDITDAVNEVAYAMGQTYAKKHNK